VKRSICVVAGVALTVMGAYYASHLFAQAPATGGNAQQPQVQGTKMAVVNIGLVFNKYVRANEFKQQLEELMKPFKAEGKKLTEEMEAWHKARETEKDQKKKEQYEAAILHNKRKLEDLQREISKKLGKQQEDNLVQLWKEVNVGIERVAVAYGFQVVYGYGDPMEKELLNQFPNINRKMQAMDLGSTVPLYVHGSVDLSQVIADTLNRWVAESNGGKK
jgi:Skp family chaperone for outer membrane proteins